MEDNTINVLKSAPGDQNQETKKETVEKVIDQRISIIKELFDAHNGVEGDISKQYARTIKMV